MSREAMKPVLWICHDCGGANQLCPHGHKDAPLYTEPQKQWVGLTDEEREFLLHQALRFYDTNAQLLSFIKTVEAKLKEKNT
jgi:hypothetical protein